MGKTSIILVGLLFLATEGMAQPIPSQATISQATNLVTQDVYMSPARIGDFWNDVGIPFVLSNGGGTIASNSIAKNNGVGTNLTIYGTLTSTNLDSKITSATNGVLATASNIFSIKGSAGGVVPAPATTSQATNLVVQDAYMSPARVGDFWNDVGIPFVLANGGSGGGGGGGTAISNGLPAQDFYFTSSPAVFANTNSFALQLFHEGVITNVIYNGGTPVVMGQGFILSGTTTNATNNLTISFGNGWLHVQTFPLGMFGLNGTNGATGDAGGNGTNATIAITNTIDGAAGSSPSVTNLGDSLAAVLQFTLPVPTNGVNGSTNESLFTNWFGSNLYQPATLNLTNWSGVGTNQVVFTNTTQFDTNGAAIAAAKVATNNLVIPSTNGFVTASITNGLATTAYVVAATNNLVIPSTNGFVTQSITNGLASITYVNAATNGFVTASITNGLATTAYVVAATNNLVTAAITNGLATTAYVVAATNNLVIPSTNGFVTQSITNGLASITYVNAATNGFVTSSITNGLATTNYVNTITNGLATTAYVVAATNAGNIVFTNTTQFDTNGAGVAAALAATNGMAQSTGLSAFQNTNFFDLAGAGTTAAMAATNALASPLSAFYNTNTFDLAGVGSRFCSNYALPNYIYNDFATNTFTIAMTTNWLCPTGVYSAKIECWGGGAGGATIVSNQYGGGGGGGSYASVTNFTTVPGNSYSLFVGGGGAVGTPGSNTTFNSTSVVANGGSVGSAGNPTGTGGAGGTAGTGDVTHTGGNGGNGGHYTSILTYDDGGGGGGGAGTTNNGGNASGTAGQTPGTGGTAGGGIGGNSAQIISIGTAVSPAGIGSLSGGGGGGGVWIFTNNEAAASGAAGKVVITYVPYIQTKQVIENDSTNYAQGLLSGIGNITALNWTNTGNQFAGVPTGIGNNFYAGAGNPGGTNTATTQNVIIGNGAAPTNGGNFNTIVGTLGAQFNTSGTRNSGFGYAIMNHSTVGLYNGGFGYQTLYNLTIGSYNSAFAGYTALYNLTTGTNNIALGNQAGFNQTVGSSNIYIGNLGVAGENGQIWIGTAGIHTNTHIAGIINGNGGGLTNIPSTSITGGIFGGSLTATNGFSSLATNTATIGTTGWTNTFGVIANVFGFTGISVVQTNADGIGFSYGTITAPINIQLQAGAYLIGTTCAANQIHAQ